MTSPPSPHPELVPYLEKHQITWEVFSNTRLKPRSVVAKRRAIVTEIHETGATWAHMVAITCLSQGSIQRLSQAKGNPLVKQRKQQIAAELGRQGKGAKKPWLTLKLQADWESGKFDFHKGRIRPQFEVDKIQASWADPARHDNQAQMMKSCWQDPNFRDNLLSFHRSDTERVKRSQAQAQRMLDHPATYMGGRGEYVSTQKATVSKTWVRSSFEKRYVEILERDPTVLSYEYEPLYVLPDGRHILPDFLVRYRDGKQELVEVKAKWVLAMPVTYKAQVRLALARELANREALAFKIVTENDLWP